MQYKNGSERSASQKSSGKSPTELKGVLKNSAQRIKDGRDSSSGSSYKQAKNKHSPGRDMNFYRNHTSLDMVAKKLDHIESNSPSREVTIMNNGGKNNKSNSIRFNTEKRSNSSMGMVKQTYSSFFNENTKLKSNHDRLMSLAKMPTQTGRNHQQSSQTIDKTQSSHQRQKSVDLRSMTDKKQKPGLGLAANEPPKVQQNIRIYNKTLEQKSRLFQQYRKSVRLNEKANLGQGPTTISPRV